jgi:hypothetical protein
VQTRGAVLNPKPLHFCLSFQDQKDECARLEEACVRTERKMENALLRQSDAFSEEKALLVKSAEEEKAAVLESLEAVKLEIEVGWKALREEGEGRPCMHSLSSTAEHTHTHTSSSSFLPVFSGLSSPLRSHTRPPFSTLSLFPLRPRSSSAASLRPS